MAGRLKDLPLLLLDGGMGTALLARGLDPEIEPTCMWNLTRPAVVRSVHQSFIDAGVSAIHTNTFSANPWQLDRADGLESSPAPGSPLDRRPPGSPAR